MEAIPFDESRSFSFSSKLILLVKVIVFAVKTMPVVEAILFSESHFSWELLLFVGTTVRSGIHFL